MTQKERVLNYMDSNGGSITSLEAFRDLGVTRLSAVIFNLKEDGFNFNEEFITCKNRFGEKVHFKRYSLGD